MSATYRGDAGIKKIISILQDSKFVIPQEKWKDRQLQLDVHGGVPELDIASRAATLALEK